MSDSLKTELDRRARGDAIYTTVIAAGAFCLGAGVVTLLQIGGAV